MKSLAIIGTGVAGLGCAHFLRERFDLTIYEQNDYIGGHTNTVTVDEEGRAVPIDTGFMVFNRVTYPNLTRLFRELNVKTKTTEMSFSVQHTPSGLEYGGGSLNELFGQRRNLFSLKHWRMLMKINRFNKEAVAALDNPRYAEMSLRDYVAERGYGNDFLQLFIVPMGGAVWSTPPALMLEFPVVTLLRFWHNHGFLGLHTQHQWYTVVNGSQSYVKKIVEPMKDRIHTRRKAERVRRKNGRVQVLDAAGYVAEYDKVIFACHGDQVLPLLEAPTETEARLLKEFKYQRNVATVHTDDSWLPKVKRCRSSWNYRIDAGEDGALLPTTHYWMNELQGVSDRVNYLVSLNCHERIAPEKVLRRIDYEHPLFSLGAIKAQAELPGLNLIGPEQTTYYAGAWFKYGFHEDGFSSALACARAVTGEAIWS